MFLDLYIALQIFDPFGAFLGFLCVLVIASILFLIFVAIWIYRDAESRGMNGTMWTLIFVLVTLFATLIGGIIVLVIYLVIRGDHPVGGRPMYAPYGYPPYGGMPPPVPPPVTPPTTAATPAAPAATTCRNCGAPLPSGVAFCPNCGTKL